MAHHQYFENHKTLPNIETKIHFPPQRMIHVQLLFYKIYTWKLNHGQTIWDEKRGVMSNILRSTLGNWKHFRILMGRAWEHIGNRPAPPPPQAPLRFLNWLHEISICKMVCHHLFIYFGTNEKFIHCLVTIFNLDQYPFKTGDETDDIESRRSTGGRKPCGNGPTIALHDTSHPEVGPRKNQARKHVYINQSFHVWDVDDEAKRVYENAIRAILPLQHTLLLRRSSETLTPIFYNLLHSLSKTFLPAHRSLVIDPELHLPTSSSLFRVFKEEPRLGI